MTGSASLVSTYEQKQIGVACYWQPTHMFSSELTTIVNLRVSLQ